MVARYRRAPSLRRLYSNAPNFAAPDAVWNSRGMTRDLVLAGALCILASACASSPATPARSETGASTTKARRAAAKNSGKARKQTDQAEAQEAAPERPARKLGDFVVQRFS